MANTKLTFEVDASQVDIKPILQKEFLELSMKAISSANPNRNNSWFTRESMGRSIETFRNKPILGYFENGDFVSHNGNWNHDSETQMDYWDTLGKQGERILGTIRESDEVKIIEDKKGLSWIVFTCILWTQYSFKQVKRLIKDAKRAAKSGDTTKNISVEVDITDYEMLPNGVMKINAFNLVGVTILGSRNGVKVEPGIEDAELSLIDIMGRDIYEKQQSSLRLAYERLNNNEKGGEQSMENPELVNNANFEETEQLEKEEEVVECKNEVETQVECGPEKLEECPNCNEEAPVEETECRGNNDCTETECRLSEDGEEETKEEDDKREDAKDEDDDDKDEEHEDECKLEQNSTEVCETEEQECRGTNENTDGENSEVNEGEDAVLDMGEPEQKQVEEVVTEEISVAELAKQAVLEKYSDICELASNYEVLLQEKEE